MSQILKDFIQCKPVDDVAIRSELERVLDELQAYHSAVSHHAVNSANYAKRIQETIELDIITDDGDLIEVSHQRVLPWAVIKEVLIQAQKLADKLKNPLA